jgi:hypothetical protein
LEAVKANEELLQAEVHDEFLGVSEMLLDCSGCMEEDGEGEE